MPIYIEPGDCAAVVITTQGNIWHGFNYSIRMSAINGLVLSQPGICDLYPLSCLDTPTPPTAVPPTDTPPQFHQRIPRFRRVRQTRLVGSVEEGGGGSDSSNRVGKNSARR